jgi:hypothetical protein
MSFDFSDLVFLNDEVVLNENENVDNNDNYDYTQFLSDPIYDWLDSPEEILQVCDDIEEKKKKRKVTIIQQAQIQNNNTHKKVSYRRGPYRKKKDRNN